MPKQIIVATRNAHKVEEIRAILKGFEVKDLSSVAYPPVVEETGTTFLANARLKAEAISRLTDSWVLADDSGLEVDALGGAPGVYSARYAGLDGDDQANNRKLLREMEGQSDRRARFRCVMVLARDGRVLEHFSGSVEGTILDDLEGQGGFGYDPLFMPLGETQSFAALGEEVKNTLSHRARALAQVAGWLATSPLP